MIECVRMGCGFRYSDPPREQIEATQCLLRKLTAQIE